MDSKGLVRIPAEMNAPREDKNRGFEAFAVTLVVDLKVSKVLRAFRTAKSGNENHLLQPNFGAGSCFSMFGPIANKGLSKGPSEDHAGPRSN